MAWPNVMGPSPSMSPLEMLRLKSIYGSQEMNNQPSAPPMEGTPNSLPPQTPNIPNIGVQAGLPRQQPDFDPVARMRELYQPQTQATDRFNQMTQEYPTFAQPSGWRRTGAAALGALTDLGTNFGGNKTGIKGTEVFDETTGKNKWRERVGNWKEQIGPAQSAANLERQENINARQLAHNTVQNELAGRKLDQTTQYQNDQTRIRQQRADAYDFRTRNDTVKNYDFNGPKVRIMYKNGQIVETNWESKDFSPQEKMELQQEQALERIKATGGEARKTEETRQEGRTDLAETRGWKPYTEEGPDGTKRTFMYNEITGDQRERNIGNTPGATPIRSGSAAQDIPSRDTDRRFNNAMSFVNANPTLRDRITINPNSKMITIKPPSPASGGLFGWGAREAWTQEQYDDAYRKIFESEPPARGSGGTTSIPAPSNPANPINTGPSMAPTAPAQPPVTTAPSYQSPFMKDMFKNPAPNVPTDISAQRAAQAKEVGQNPFVAPSVPIPQGTPQVPIYERGKQQQQIQATPPPAPKFTPQNPPPAPPGFRYVLKPDGQGWTAVPLGQQ